MGEQADAYLRRNNDADTEIERLTGIISKLEGDLQTQITSANSYCAKVIDAEKALAGVKLDQEKSVYDLKLALKDSNNHADAFGKAQKTIKEGADRITQLEATVADNQKIILRLTDGLAQLKELQSADNGIDPLVYAGLEEKYAKLEADCNKLRDDVIGANAANARLSGEVSKLQHTLDEAMKREEAATKELNELKASSQAELKELRARQQHASKETNEIVKDLQGQIVETRQKSMADMTAKERKFAEDIATMQAKLDKKEADLLSAMKNLMDAKEDFSHKTNDYELQIKELSVKLDHANSKVSAHDDQVNVTETHIKEKDQELQRLNRETSQKQAELEYQLQHALNHANRLIKDLEAAEERIKQLEHQMTNLTPRSSAEAKSKEYENRLNVLNVKLEHAAKTIENKDKASAAENEKLRKAESEVSRLNGELLESDAKLKYALNTISNYDSDADKHAKDLQKSADEIAKLSSLLASTERKLLKMTDNFNQSVESMKTKDEEIKRLVNELTVNGSDKDIVKKELGDALRKIDELEIALKTANETIANFQPSMDLLKKEAEDSLAIADENLKEATDKLAAEVALRTEKEESLVKALLELEGLKQAPSDSNKQEDENQKLLQAAMVTSKKGDKEIARLAALNKQLDNSLRNANKEIESLRKRADETATLVDERNAAVDEAAAVAVKVKQLEDELAELNNLKDAAVTEREAIKEVSVALTGDENTDKLKGLLLATQQENNRLSKLNKDLVNENQSMRSKIAKLEKHVRELTENNELLDGNQQNLRDVQAREIQRLNDIITSKLAEKDDEINELRSRLGMEMKPTVDNSFDEGQTSHEVSFDTADPSKDKEEISEMRISDDEETSKAVVTFEEPQQRQSDNNQQPQVQQQEDKYEELSLDQQGIDDRRQPSMLSLNGLFGFFGSSDSKDNSATEGGSSDEGNSKTSSNNQVKQGRRPSESPGTPVE